MESCLGGAGLEYGGCSGTGTGCPIRNGAEASSDVGVGGYVLILGLVFLTMVPLAGLLKKGFRHEGPVMME